MTRRRLSMLALIVILGITSVTVRADSNPPIQGSVFGIELCQQSVCGVAIFVGAFKGYVGTRPAFGTVSVAVTHAPLPDPFAYAPILGGTWTIQLLSGRKFSGLVTGGSLFNNDNNTYQVAVDMSLVSGGAGTLSFYGLLNHQTIIPTISGVISQ